MWKQKKLLSNIHFKVSISGGGRDDLSTPQRERERTISHQHKKSVVQHRSKYYLTLARLGQLVDISFVKTQYWVKHLTSQLGSLGQFSVSNRDTLCTTSILLTYQLETPYLNYVPL